MLFPHEPVRVPTERDAWLIDRYHPPGEPDGVEDGLYYPAADLRPRLAPPAKLIHEVDCAYYRLSLQQTVDQWFVKRGFDLSLPTIPRKDFNLALGFAEKRRANQRLKIKEVAEFVISYFDGTPHPTLTDCEDKYSQEHGSSARELLRATYRVEAEKRAITVTVGRPKKSAK